MFTPLKTSSPAHRAYTAITHYAIARDRPVAPITRAELSRAVLAMPLAFQRIQQGVVLVAIMGVTSDRNLFVTEDNRWAGPYVPATFRAYPFAMGQTPDGKHVVCVDEDSGCMGDGPDARPLFNEDDTPSALLTQIMQFLQHVDQDRKATDAACAALDRHGLLEEWPIKVQTEDGQPPRSLTGFLTVNEARLGELSADALVELRTAGALAVAYGQLFASGHLPALGRLAAAHAKAAEKMRQKAKDNAGMFEDPGLTFNFD